MDRLQYEEILLTTPANQLAKRIFLAPTPRTVSDIFT